MSLESFSSNCNFYDTIHFRHGFARAGVFTRRESDILSRCGYIIKQLENGSLTPENEDHKSMLNMLTGVSEPSNEVERAWAKYLIAINSRVMRFNSLSDHLSGVDYSSFEGDDAW